MNTLNYHDVACKIYENLDSKNVCGIDYLNNGWSGNKDFIALDRSDRLKVSRIINNWIRQDFY
jgi:hypothetical protein